MFILIDAERSGTAHNLGGDPTTFDTYTVEGAVETVQLYGLNYRPALAQVHSDGGVNVVAWVFLVRVTTKGVPFKNGFGVWETVQGLEKFGLLPEMTSQLREAIADYKEDAIEQELRGIVASATKITFPDTLRWHAVNELRAQILDQGNRLLHATPWNQNKAIGVMRLRYNDFLAATSRPRAMADVRANLHKIAVEEAAGLG